jgi:ATP-binding cassette subfamily B protein
MSDEHQHEEEKLGKVTDWPLLRRLLGYLHPYRGRVAIGIGLLIIHSAVRASGPILYKLAVDLYMLPNPEATAKLTWLTRGLPSEPFAGLNQIALIYLTLVLVGFASAYGQAIVMLMTGQYVMYDLRRKIFSHLQKLEIAFYDRNPVGRLVTRVTNDIDQLNEMFTAGVHAIFGDILTLAGIGAWLLYLDWKLALLMFIVIPLIALVSFVFRNFARKYHRRTRVTLAKINTFLNEHLGGMSVVQLFNREKQAAGQFADINQENRLAWRDAIFAHSLFYPTIESLTSLAIAFIVAYGGARVLNTDLSLGDLTAFLLWARQFFEPIRDLADKYGILQTALASSERIFTLLDTPVTITSPEQPQALPPKAGRVEFRNVWFAYKGEDWVLEDVSFTIEPGEMAAFVGHTGAGKTTVTNLLMRFYDIQQGVILLDDVDIRELNLQDLRTRFAMGINHEVRERGATLSGGQKQLISFARSLAHDPEILILDEATSSVDTQTEHMIQEALERLIAGRTSIVVAHRLSTIHRADKILVFHKGRLREQGAHQSLLAERGLYYKLYQLQYRDQEVGALADDD